MTHSKSSYAVGTFLGRNSGIRQGFICCWGKHFIFISKLYKMHVDTSYIRQEWLLCLVRSYYLKLRCSSTLLVQWLQTVGKKRTGAFYCCFGSDPYGCLRPFCQKKRSYLFVLPSSTSTSNIKWYLLDCSSHDCRIIIVASGTINIMLPLRSDSRCRGKIIRVLQRGYQHYFRLNP